MVDEDALNVSVIRSYDPFCTHVIDKSASAHVYVFENETNSWVKSKIGGVFFLYKRSKVPYHSFMILNRKSPDRNQVEYVTATLQLQLHSPFLLYKTAKGDIYSIWFFSKDDCMRIAECLGKMIYELGGLGLRVATTNDSKNKPSAVDHNKSLQSQATAQKLSQLMNLIRRSGDSADERIPNHISEVVKSAKSGDKKSAPTRSQTSEPPNLFEMLHKAEVDFNSETSRKSNPVPEPNINMELQKLRTACNITSPNSKGQNLMHKLSNGTVPSYSTQTSRSSPPHQSGHHISVAELEQQLLQEHTLKIPSYFAGDECTDESSTDDPSNQPAAFKSSTAPPASIANLEPRLITPSRLLSDLDAGYADDIDEAEDEETLMSCSDKGHRKPRRYSRHHEPVDQTAKPVSKLTWSEREVLENVDDQDDFLVTPNMLISPPSSTFTSTGIDSIVVSSNTSHQPNRASPLKPTPLIGMPDTSVELHPQSSTTKTNPSDGLTKEQLREALVHLIQTDDDFLHRIHSAYIASLQRRIIK